MSQLIHKLITKRTTWLFLFISVYTLLISLSINLFKSILSWHDVQSSESPSIFPSLYASVAIGLSFGLLSMAAAAAVAVPATVVTWITVLVLLACCGKKRESLIVEGRRLTVEIGGFVGRVLIVEGNFVAGVFAVFGCILLLVRRHCNKEIEIV